MDVPLSWQTDIAVLVASGSSAEEHADHLVVGTPANPTYAWGNFVMVTDLATVDDACRWEAVFASSFPDAGHRAIGLLAPPTDDAAWEAAGPVIGSASPPTCSAWSRPGRRTAVSTHG